MGCWSGVEGWVGGGSDLMSDVDNDLARKVERAKPCDHLASTPTLDSRLAYPSNAPRVTVLGSRLAQQVLQPHVLPIA